MRTPTQSWDGVPIRWSGRIIDGSYAEGQLVITANTNRFLDTTGADAVSIFTTPIIVPIIGGRAEFDLPATDDPDITPTGFTYTIREVLNKGQGTSITIAVPKAMQATGIDLNRAINVPASAGTPSDTITRTELMAAIEDARTKQSVSEKGQPGGYAALGSDGKVPASQLPAGTAILPYATANDFPRQGSTAAIYIDTATNTLYRWTGVTYASIGGTTNSGGGLTANDLTAALARYQATSEKGQPGGYAALGSDGKVPTAQLPALQAVSEKGRPNGYPALDGAGRLPTSQLPTSVPTTDALISLFVPVSPTAPDPTKTVAWLDISSSPPVLRYWTNTSWEPIYTPTSQGQVSSYFTVTDNGDGTITYTGNGSSTVTDNGDGTITFTGPGVTDNGDGTMTFA